MLLLITILGMLSYFIPGLIVYFKKLWHDVNLRLICIYWMLCGFINSIDLFGTFPSRAIEIFNVSYNFLVIPMVMLLLYINTSSKLLKKCILAGISVVVIFQVIGISTSGYIYDSLKYSLGVGVFLFLIFIFWEILRFFQNIAHTKRERRMLFIYIAMAFDYGSYLVIYYFEYYFPEQNALVFRDTQLLYYASAMIAMIIASVGLLLNHSPSRKFDENLFTDKMEVRKGWN